MGNPVLELYKLMGDATPIPKTSHFATVKNPLPNLKINLGDLELDKEDFLVCSSLIANNGDKPLKVGDILLVSEFEDNFIIIDRVINI